MSHIDMFEVDFDTMRCDVNRLTRKRLDMQCSEGESYFCFKILCVKSMRTPQPSLERGQRIDEYLDMALLAEQTLVVHVKNNDVCASTILLKPGSNSLAQWISGNMAEFHNTVRGWVV